VRPQQFYTLVVSFGQVFAKSPAGPDGIGRLTLPKPVRSVLSSAGTPLPAALRADFGPRLSRDLSEVRVHHDAEAAVAAQSVHSRAFAVGHHIVFNAGEYRPASPEGRRVLAHELVHVAQQSGTAATGDVQLGPVGDTLEREADQLATHPAPPAHRALANRLSRLPSWQSIKTAAYDHLIAGLRTAHRAGITGLRGLAGRMPAALQLFANIAIDQIDLVFEILIGLILAVVGIVVGFAEGVVGLITGLVQLAVGILRGLYSVAADLFTGGWNRTEAWWASFIQAIKSIPAGLRALVTNWLTEFERASPEKAALMIGELTGQILAIIATFAVAAARAGTAGALASEGEAAATTAETVTTTAARGAKPALTMLQGGGQPAVTMAARSGSGVSQVGNAAVDLAGEAQPVAGPALRLVPPPAADPIPVPVTPAPVPVTPAPIPAALGSRAPQAARVGAIAAGHATRVSTAADPAPAPAPAPGGDDRKGKSEFRMRAQIQEKTAAGRDIHYGNAVAMAKENAKGVTAAEFEEAQASAKSNALAKKMPGDYVEGVDKAKSQQSRLIRSTVIPGGIPATRVGDINELRVSFDPRSMNLVPSGGRGKVRLDVENLAGHNLRFPR